MCQAGGLLAKQSLLVIPLNSTVAFGQRPCPFQAPSLDMSREGSVPSTPCTASGRTPFIVFPPKHQITVFFGEGSIKMQGNMGLLGLQPPVTWN